MTLTLGQIADWIHAEGDFDSAKEAVGYSIDSRTVGAGGMQAVHPTAELKDGSIIFNKKLRVGNGASQLVGMIKAGGDQMATDPTYMADRLPGLARVLPQLRRLRAQAPQR